MRKFEATPFPAAATSHDVPVTALERRMLLMCLAQFAGKKPEEVRERREAFIAAGAGAKPPLEWETPGQLAPDMYDSIVRMTVTKKMIRTIKAVFEEALASPNPQTGLSFLGGTQSFALGELVDRLEWTNTATVDL